jgi:hypothetical protein
MTPKPRRKTLKKLVLILVATAAVAFPAGAGAATLKGIVVGKQSTRHVLVVAGRGGAAWSIHTASSARVGAVVTATARRNADGTYAASAVRVRGRASHARVHGVVIGAAAGMTFLSAGRSVLVVRSHARSLFSTSAGPAPGTVANVGVTIGQSGALTATSMTPTGQTNQIVIQATVAGIVPPTATTPGSLTLTINGQTLIIPLAAGTTVPATLTPGSTVTLTVKFGASGATGTNAKDDEDDDDQGEDEDDDSGSDSGSDSNSD